ncbi:MAG TPA: hypothetical protein VGF30_13290 [Bacteroidia bacterium]
MSYIDKKYTIIKDLVKSKKEADHALTLITAENDALTVALNTKTLICANDLKDLTNIKATSHDIAIAHHKIKSLQADIKHSCEKAEELLKNAEEMFKDAHNTARRTIECAVQFTELNKHINSQEKGGTSKDVLFALIANEAATFGPVCEKAVTDANNALKDAITALSNVVHLHYSLTRTKELIDDAIDLLQVKDKKTGIHESLEALKHLTHKHYEESHKEQQTAEHHSRDKNKELTEATNKLGVITKQLDAAEKAIALAAAN